MSENVSVLVEKLNECKQNVSNYALAHPETALAWATLGNAYARIIAATITPVVLR